MILYQVRWVKHWQTGLSLDKTYYWSKDNTNINVAFQSKAKADAMWPDGECIVEEQSE